MKNGVTIIDPDNTYIDCDVQIGSDTVIEPGVYLKGRTIVGNDCFIGANSEIVNSVLDDEVTVTSSLIEEAHMQKESNIGPYSHLRPLADIGEGVHIGNFVEVKKAKIGKNTKVGHLTYVGMLRSEKKSTSAAEPSSSTMTASTSIIRTLATIRSSVAAQTLLHRLKSAIIPILPQAQRLRTMSSRMTWQSQGVVR